MFKLIDGVLNEAQVAELRDLSGRARFVDGRVSNPHSKVKNNLQLHDPNHSKRAAEVLAAGLLGNPEFLQFAFPKAIAPPILTRYDPGMTYGLHADAAMMQLATGPLRSDLSCTIFLSDPADYDGGALHIVMGSAELRFRGPAGSAIVYPSTTLHEVEPVTRGSRLVGLTFIQSRIADPLERDILYELGEVAALEGNAMDPANYVRLRAVESNLMRRFATP